MKIDKRFQNLLGVCKARLDDMDIPYYGVYAIEVNTRAKKRWGQCVINNCGGFNISLSDRLLKADDKAIETVIIHELLHTVKDCFNHGDKWQYYAERMNREYGYNIKRTASSSEYNVEPIIIKKVYRYKVVCNQCNHESFYQKKSKVIENISHYRCGRCKGTLQAITI